MASTDSPKAQPSPFYVPNPLTPSEIASLRQHAHDSMADLQEMHAARREAKALAAAAASKAAAAE